MDLSPQLPLKILLQIAYVSIDTYRLMLAVPEIGRFSLHNGREIRAQFVIKTVHRGSTVVYTLGGRRHCEDGPAEIYQRDGKIFSKRWWLYGKLHRVDGPAVEFSNGNEKWYREGKLHRRNGPAYTMNGGKIIKYYIDGKLHREDGPAAVNKVSSKWFYCDKPHCITGPAFTFIDGRREWYRCGLLHREDGPAVEFNGVARYYLYGVRVG